MTVWGPCPASGIGAVAWFAIGVPYPLCGAPYVSSLRFHWYISYRPWCECHLYCPSLLFRGILNTLLLPWCVPVCLVVFPIENSLHMCPVVSVSWPNSLWRYTAYLPLAQFQWCVIDHVLCLLDCYWRGISPCSVCAHTTSSTQQIIPNEIRYHHPRLLCPMAGRHSIPMMIIVQVHALVQSLFDHKMPPRWPSGT